MIAKLNTDMQLYRTLSAGDLPAAYLVVSSDKNTLYSEDNPAVAFNRGLCFYLLEEYEDALSELKNAERLAGNPPELDVSKRKLFERALELSGQELAEKPIDPGGAAVYARYVLIRAKWLAALCLKALGRDGEAAMTKRFLLQYKIKL